MKYVDIKNTNSDDKSKFDTLISIKVMILHEPHTSISKPSSCHHKSLAIPPLQRQSSS
jgi:hypothetical protein